MSINLMPYTWETGQLHAADSTPDEIPEIQEICNACSYIHEWTGWKTEDHPGATMLSVFTDGELPPNGSKDFFRLQSVRLRDTGQMIGFLEAYHGFPTPDTFWAVYLAIHPRFQGKGFGQELIHELSDIVRQLKYTRIRLVASLKNWPALRFWIKEGFDKIADMQGDKLYSEKTFADFILEKSLVQ
jgi:ribosomal protein S18 acetylase RimI-like enzyme